MENTDMTSQMIGGLMREAETLEKSRREFLLKKTQPDMLSQMIGGLMREAETLEKSRREFLLKKTPLRSKKPEQIPLLEIEKTCHLEDDFV